ncbi:hypothetical protein MGA3_15196 [Bacillus methanolicus MGA3]|nr:hypothetical protein MGA3_15196 [Bacillus methanolicus MGA3]
MREDEKIVKKYKLFLKNISFLFRLSENINVIMFLILEIFDKLEKHLIMKSFKCISAEEQQ